MFSRLTSLAVLATAFAAASAQNVLDSSDYSFPDAPVTTTQTDSIVSNAATINQKGGAPANARPNLPAAGTVVTFGDGSLSARSEAPVKKRSIPGRFLGPRATGFTQAFPAKCNKGDADCRDAAVIGTGYLTYTVVNNATYNVDACATACSKVDKCAFFNLYYEFNNNLLDHVFTEGSNLKCVMYSDVHTAEEKTNAGGQSLIDGQPQILNYIQQSTGYTNDALVNTEPAVPAGYSKVDMPQSGANNAPGYMGFVFLSNYDVAACAALCNTRDADATGGVCQYFNIWTALDVAGNPTTYTCSLYYLVADKSTAVNTGNSVITVSRSRGYARQSLIADGGFESYGCNNAFCAASSYTNWITKNSLLQSLFVYSAKYARTGHGLAVLGFGTITPAKKFATVKDAKYQVQFFMNPALSTIRAKNIVTSVNWNGKDVCDFTTSSSTKAGYRVYTCTVTGTGNDVFALDSNSVWSWSNILARFRLIDDVSIFQM